MRQERVNPGCKFLLNLDHFSMQIDRFGTRLATRTKRVAAKSIAAIPAESIPFIGVAVPIAGAGYELYAASETVKNLDQLYSDLGGG
jgi:hypothetical protein